MSVRARVVLPCTVLLLFALSTYAQVAPRQLITQPVDERQLITLQGNTHPLVKPQFDIGTASPDEPLRRMLLVLKRSPEQEFALRKLLDDQQDKASPNYHKWLTPDEFGAQFGPADQDLQTVSSWLQSHGLQINRVTHGKTIVEFSGVESQVEEALHTQIHKYLVNGEEHWANASDPQIPAALAPVVAGVASLNNFPRKPMFELYGTYYGKSRKVIPAKPQFTFNGNCDPDGFCYAVGPADFGAIYNAQTLWTSGIDGSGQKIAIVGESDINIQDVRDFRTLFGLPAKDPVIIHDGPAPGLQPDEGEADIDVQWSGAIAPNATIDFVVSESTEINAGVDLSALYIVDNNLAPVLSESYGFCELGLGTSGNQFFSSLWEQAAAQGITAILSAGDSGAAGCDWDGNSAPAPAEFGLAVSGFASTPFNVAIGGTDFQDAFNPQTYWNTSNTSPTFESAKGYIPEVPWNDSCANPIWSQVGFSTNAETNCNNSQLGPVVVTVGGGGGVSKCTTNSQALGTCSGGYSKPSWQVGTLNDGKRDVPDISFFASNGFVGNFYVFCESDAFGSCNSSEFGAAGGTSFGAPAFAGVMALVNQEMQATKGQGNANYVLYKLATEQTSAECNSNAVPGANCVFNDITSGTIAMPCAAGISPDCVVKTTGHKYGILAGYNAGSGYDLATGLGSVNVGNLVNDWKNVTFRTTSTTLTLSPDTNLSHGQQISVTGSVAPTSGSGVPTGDVSLLTSTGLSAGVFTLGNGSVSGNTSLLPGGTYTVTAHYSGDTTFGGSDSAPVSIDVVPEPSKTFAELVTLDNNGNVTSFAANSATYGGGFFLLRVDVGDAGAFLSPAAGISSNCEERIASCPTGTVSVTSNGSPLAGGSFPLNISGYAEDQSLTPGTYSVSAVYPGDASYKSSSAATSFIINKAPTTAAAAVGGLPVQYGNAEEIAAGITTNSNGVAPTGTFTFSTDGSPTQLVFGGLVYEGFPAGPNTPANLNATGTTVFLSLGNHTLGVQYSGDSNYGPSTSPPTVVSVVPAIPIFLGWGASPNPAAWQQSVTLSAFMDGSEFGAAPTGTMTFFDNGNAISENATYTVDPPGYSGSVLQGSLVYTPATPGVHNITLSYSGDANYTSANSPGADVLTVGGPFSITPAAALSVSSPGQSASTTLTIAPNGGFTGNVNLTCSPDPNAKETSCSFGSGSAASSSTQVTLNGSSANVTFNVTTTAPHAVSAPSAAVIGASGGFLAAAFLVLPFSQRRYRSVITTLALAAVLALGGCGGGGSGTGGGGGGGNTDPGTGAGTYSFTLTGTTASGSSAISVTSSVTVAVQ